MISKIIKIIILILNLQFVNLIANANIYIEVKIEDEVITNYDIKKEYNYLLSINKNLKKLSLAELFTPGKTLAELTPQERETVNTLLKLTFGKKD